MFMSGTFDDAANIDAINTYIAGAKIKTAAGAKARDAWILWHDKLGWYDKSFPSIPIYDQARNLRNEFNIANAETPAEKKDVKQQQQTGLTSEELRGEASRRLSTGDYLEHPEESEPWLPAKTKIAIGIFAGVAIAGRVAYGVYVKPWLKALTPR